MNCSILWSVNHFGGVGCEIVLWILSSLACDVLFVIRWYFVEHARVKVPIWCSWLFRKLRIEEPKTSFWTICIFKCLWLLEKRSGHLLQSNLIEVVNCSILLSVNHFGGVGCEIVLSILSSLACDVLFVIRWYFVEHARVKVPIFVFALDFG